MNWYLFAGYAVFWILIGLYIIYLQRKQANLARDLETIKNMLDK